MHLADHSVIVCSLLLACDPTIFSAAYHRHAAGDQVSHPGHMLASIGLQDAYLHLGEC